MRRRPHPLSLIGCRLDSQLNGPDCRADLWSESLVWLVMWLSSRLMIGQSFGDVCGFAFISRMIGMTSSGVFFSSRLWRIFCPDIKTFGLKKVQIKVAEFNGQKIVFKLPLKFLFQKKEEEKSPQSCFLPLQSSSVLLRWFVSLKARLCCVRLFVGQSLIFSQMNEKWMKSVKTDVPVSVCSSWWRFRSRRRFETFNDVPASSWRSY